MGNLKGLVLKMAIQLGALKLEAEKYKKAYEKERAENVFLKERLQVQIPFEARG